MLHADALLRHSPALTNDGQPRGSQELPSHRRNGSIHVIFGAVSCNGPPSLAGLGWAVPWFAKYSAQYDLTSRTRSALIRMPSPGRLNVHL